MTTDNTLRCMDSCYICSACWVMYLQGEPHSCDPKILTFGISPSTLKLWETAATASTEPTSWWNALPGVPSGLGATYVTSPGPTWWTATQKTEITPTEAVLPEEEEDGWQ